MIELVDTGQRVKTLIDGEAYYIFVGQNSLQFTAPHENTEEMREERQKLDALAETITLTRGGRVD